MSSQSRRTRLVVIPLLLFLGVSATVFVLAKLHPARSTPKAVVVPGGAAVQFGDAYRGETVFQQSCAGCHGDAGSGGSGPKLVGTGISSAAIRAQIDNGGVTMPASTVSGRQEQDVLAYLAGITSGSG